jgi:uncharacterized protein YhfF
MTNQHKDLWIEFLKVNPDLPTDTPFQTWYFGDNRALADELVELVVAGRKTATASLYWEYEAGQEILPEVGGFSLITDFDGNPRCVIETVEVRILPFDEVDPQFAAAEGEGDLSLDYWRRAHWNFFSRACERLGRQPDARMPVVCERFRKVYP